MWGLEGLKRLTNNGFKFTEIEELKRLLEEYKIKSNSILLFVNECCIVNENLQISSNDLYATYKCYCDDDNLKAVSKTKFREELVSNYPSKIRKTLVTSKRISGLSGIGLSSEYINEHPFTSYDSNSRYTSNNSTQRSPKEIVV